MKKVIGILGGMGPLATVDLYRKIIEVTPASSAIILENMGADFLVMACNTAYCYYDKITPFIKIPIINMIEETCEELRRLGIKTVGILATDGVIAIEGVRRDLSKKGT